MFRQVGLFVSIALRRHSSRSRKVPWAALVLTVAGAMAPVSVAKDSEAAFSAKITISATMEAALEASASRNAPILVVMHTDQEPACARSESDIYRNQDFALATRQMVVVVASPDDHGGADGCPRFPGTTCAQHNAAFDALFPRYFAHGSEVVIPQHLFLSTDGGLIERVEYLRTKADLTRLMKEAVAYVANPEKAIKAREKSTLKTIQELAAKSGSAPEKAARLLLRDLGTVYGKPTIELLMANGSTSAKLALLPYLSEKKEHADAVFVALLGDSDARVRTAVEVAVRDFPVICIEARARLRDGVVAKDS